MSQSLLKAEHIKISFGNVHALRDVSLEILPGEIHCLAGENGCGKSTIIKIISGVYQRDGGTIEFNGQKIDKISPIDAINLGIQVIYQDFALFPNLTVAENLALNTELASRKKTVSWKNVRKIAEEAVSKINFRVDLDEKVEKLTVAQKQMVAISRALMSNAKLIIMDEPTTALTKKEVSALFKIILKLKEQGIAILFISHKLDEVFEISDRFTIFRDGELVATGSTKELDDKKFTYYMTGREFSDNIFVPKNVSDKPVFELKHLTLNGSFSDINLSLRRGDDDDKIRLNQRKPSKYKGLRRFGPEKNLQRINKFMKERPIFYKNLIQMKENIRFYLRCFYCITKVMILQFNSENRTELARNG